MNRSNLPPLHRTFGVVLALSHLGVALNGVDVPAEWAYPISAKDTSAPGFRGLINQVRKDAALLPSLPTAEEHLAGTLIDATTGLPYVNMVVTTTNTTADFFGWYGYKVRVDGSFADTNINYSTDALGYPIETGAFTAGEGYPDAPFPGLPGSNDATFETAYDNAEDFSLELQGFLELPAGGIVLGVHHAHAIQVSLHPNNARDMFRIPVIENPTTAGLGHRTVTLQVAEAGLYDVRVVVSHWNGNASLEFYTASPDDPQNTRALINDSNNPQSVRSWRALTLPRRPYVRSVSPGLGATGVDPAAPIEVVIADPDTTAPVMKVNGVTVAPQTAATPGELTLTYQPPAPLPGGAVVEVEVGYGGTTGKWTFVTRTGRKVLLIGGGTSAGSGEQALALRLATQFGLDTTYVDDNDLSAKGGTNLVANHILVINSSSVNSGLVAPLNFEELGIPLMNVESANVDDLLIADAPFSQGNNPVSAALVIDDPAHPLAGSLPAGTNVVMTAAVQQHRGTCPVNGIPVGKAVDFETRGGVDGLLYGIEAGQAVTLADATEFIHPARRVHFGFMGDQGAATFNEDGWKLFDAAISWLLPDLPVAPPKFNPVILSGTDVVISWTGQGTLQESSTVNGGWVVSASQANPQAVPATGTKFYRLRQ